MEIPRGRGAPDAGFEVGWARRSALRRDTLAEGIVNLLASAHIVYQTGTSSHRRNARDQIPDVKRPGTKYPVLMGTQHVSAGTKQVINGTVCREKALRLPHGFEAPHLPLPRRVG